MASSSGFYTALAEAVSDSGGHLCVGIDPDPGLIPEKFAGSVEGILEFNLAIIKAALPFAAAFKLNLAFFENLGTRGGEILSATRRAIPAGRIAIADGKRGDIGNSAKFYAQAIFDGLKFDAATVNPYMGYDAVKPFIERAEKGAFVLALTSNPSADDFQFIGGKRKLFEMVAEKSVEWNLQGNIGLVAGATQSRYLRRLREIAPDIPFLIPGVGAQGGDLQAVVENALKGFPGGGLINSSRGIIYASKGDDFAEAAAQAAKKLRDQINAFLK